MRSIGVEFFCYRECDGNRYRNARNSTAQDRDLMVGAPIEVAYKARVADVDSRRCHDHCCEKREYRIEPVVPVVEPSISTPHREDDPQPHGEGDYGIDEGVDPIGAQCKASQVGSEVYFENPNDNVSAKRGNCYTLPQCYL